MEALAAQARREGADPARRQADYLKRFLADSIIRDFEYLRLSEFGGARWATLGQSYGGFLTLANLSTFPAGVAAAFTCGEPRRAILGFPMEARFRSAGSSSVAEDLA